MRTLSRNDFFKLVMGGIGGGWLLSACGDDGGDDDGDEGANTGAGKDGGSSGGNGADGSNNGNPNNQDAGAIANQDAGPTPGMRDAGTTPSLDSGTPPVKDSGVPADSGMPKMCTTDPKITITSGHPHTLTIPVADVTAGVEKTYVIAGGHMHNITLSAAQLAMVKAGTSVTVTSTQGGSGPHSHMVQIICA